MSADRPMTLAELAVEIRHDPRLSEDSRDELFEELDRVVARSDALARVAGVFVPAVLAVTFVGLPAFLALLLLFG